MSDKQSINQALKELEKITSAFDQEDLDLEKAIPKFKQALKLAKDLKNRLTIIKNELEEINLDEFNQDQ